MMLADMGAEVIRVDRSSRVSGPDPRRDSLDFMNRSRRSIGVDLKHPDGVETVLRLVEQADILIEGFRPGVMERLGLGPDTCMARNPRIVYGRMTGWGQDGPLAQAPGHDINYIALAGVLHCIGRAGERPVPPVNFIGDFGGGGMLLAFGVLAALVERMGSGKGQVVDAAMVDGSALLSTVIHGFRAMSGFWRDERGTNILDSGAHFNDTYETADGKYVSVGSLEPQFYAELLRLTGIEGEDLPPQMDHTQWPAMKERMAAIFKMKTRDEWCELAEGKQVCFAPVLSMDEAMTHPHNRARGTFVEIAGQMQPAPAPRFSRSSAAVSCPPPQPGQHTAEVLSGWGFSNEEIGALRDAKAVS
jgi:alpha-methylacyl-CoA racemase